MNSSSRMETLRASMRADGERQQRLQKALEAAEAELVRQQAAFQMANEEFRALARRGDPTSIEQLHEVGQRQRDAEMLRRVAEERVVALEEELRRLAVASAALQRGLDDGHREAAQLAREIVSRSQRLTDEHEALATQWNYLRAWAGKLAREEQYVAGLRTALEGLIGKDAAGRELVGVTKQWEAAQPRPWGVNAAGSGASGFGT